MRTSYKIALGALAVLLIFCGYKYYKSRTIPKQSAEVNAIVEDKAKKLFDDYISEFGKTTGNLTAEAKEAVKNKLDTLKKALAQLGFGIYQKAGGNAPYGLTLEKSKA